CTVWSVLSCRIRRILEIQLAYSRGGEVHRAATFSLIAFLEADMNTKFPGTGMRETNQTEGGTMKLCMSFVLVLFWLLVTVAVCCAQDGVITGRVSDPSDSIIPGVTITLTSPQVMGER